jgi:hypothetical protein
MRLDAAQGDGAPLRVHLQRLRSATGRIDPLLAQSSQPLPASVAPLWDALVQICGTRAPGAPVSCIEIEAWQRLHGVRLTPWEVDTVLACDRATRALPVQRKDLSA